MCKVYGYCRISRRTQNIERQERNIKSAYPTATIVKEAYTGTTTNRPKWNSILEKVEAGDTIIFDSVSRMSRNAEEGLKIYEELFNKGVNLVFIKEPHINTETYKRAMNNQIGLTETKVDLILEGVNQYLMYLAQEQIRLAFDQAEKEVLDLHQRTKEGIETARLNGKQIGLPAGTKLETRKSKNAKIAITRYSKDFEGQLNDEEVMKLVGLSRNTYYKYKRELKNQMLQIQKNQ